MHAESKKMTENAVLVYHINISLLIDDKCSDEWICPWFPETRCGNTWMQRWCRRKCNKCGNGIYIDFFVTCDIQEAKY